MNSKENNQLKKTDKKKTLGLIFKILGVAILLLQVLTLRTLQQESQRNSPNMN